MSRPRRRIRASVTALVTVPVLILLAGCGSSGPSSPTASPTITDVAITIAMEGPLTGDQASNGQDMLRGVQLAVNQVNAKGGLLGRRVALVEADDQADPATGQTVADQVVAGESVAVIGPYNSAVGIENLSIYTDGEVVPIHMTSTDETSGEGVTVQPKNSQISPVELAYISALEPGTVSMLRDPSAYTQGMAKRLAEGLSAAGVNVRSVSIKAGQEDYSKQVARALANNPDVVYVSTYFPEGGLIGKALKAQAAKGNKAQCFMGLANQDPGFITESGLAAARACVFSGVPSPDQFPSAARYTAAYVKTFSKDPGTWGTFTYDSANVLFDAIARAGTTEYGPVLSQLQRTTAFAGATGEITIDPETGNRVNPPVKILKVGKDGTFIVIK